MPETTQANPFVRFGTFELNRRTGELRKSGTRIRLQDQPMQILTILLERPGELVTREEIQERLWPGDTFVDFDNAINSAVRKLRDALSDRAENPQFVETLARRGYRFISPVSRGPGALTEPLAVPSDSKPGSPGPSVQTGTNTDRARPRAWRHAAVAAAVFAALGLGLWAWAARSTRPSPVNEFRATPLTAYPGAELEPTFSPDGTRVGFAWNGPGEDNFDIYAKLIGPGDPIRLTKDPASDRAPAWSPDGRWIAFLRELTEDESAVILVPALGGPERELTRVEIHWIGTWAVPGRYLTWSADGKWVLTINGRARGGVRSYRVVAVSVDTGEQRPVTDPPPGVNGDGGLSVSPDGRVLAFTRSIAYRPRQLFTIQLSADMKPGSQVRLDSGDDPSAKACAMDWTGDGREMVFSTCGYGTWRRPALGSRPAVRLAGVGENSRNLAVSREGRRLVYSDGGEDDNIWRIGVNDNRRAAPAPFINSTKSETNVQYSPDGKKIAFESARSGTEEIWVCDQDGANAVQITSFGSGYSGTPRWSPDGRSIAFDRAETDTPWGIYVVSSQGGRPVQLVKGGSNNYVPSWSRDGEWIYFTSDRTSRHEVFKIRVKGGPERQVTTSGGLAGVESVDGRELYFKKPSESSKSDELWKMPVGGGENRKVLDSAYDRDFVVTGHGIYFVSRSGKRADIQYLDFGTRRVTKLGSYRGGCPGFTVSPDERWILFTQLDVVSSDLMLVENFR